MQLFLFVLLTIINDSFNTSHCVKIKKKEKKKFFVKLSENIIH